MLKTRLIPVLLLKNGILVRSRRFSFHQSTGNHLYQVERLSAWKADEIIYLDISRESDHCMKSGTSVIGSTSSNLHNTKPNNVDIRAVVSDISKVCRVPLTIGGRIKTLEEIRIRLSMGADKVSINTAALNNPDFIQNAAREFGSQCIVVSIDVKKEDDSWVVYKDFGKTRTNFSVEEWIKKVEDLGAGEILIQSIDRDGSGLGYDLELLKFVNKVAKIPIIVLGGVGEFEHFVEASMIGKNIALSAANIFHFTEQSVLKVKKYLSIKGLDIRI
jgi:imidazole glycerol-phosphate synthase subunit HisF